MEEPNTMPEPLRITPNPSDYVTVDIETIIRGGE